MINGPLGLRIDPEMGYFKELKVTTKEFQQKLPTFK